MQFALNLYSIFYSLLSHNFWKNKRLVPLARFLKLQLTFALGKKKIHTEWFKGIFFIIERGDNALTGNYYYGLYEFDDMAFLIHCLKEKDTFLDVGANLGPYSLLASGLCGSLSIAYEPVPSTYAKLINLINIQHFRKRIIAKKIALTSLDFCNDKLLFSTDKGCCNSFVDEKYKGKKEYVMSSSLDKETENIEPNLLKIDVENFEYMVIKGADVLLGKSSLMAIIIEGQTEKVNNIIRSKGFSDYNYSPFNRKLSPHFKKKINRIWIRDSKLEEVKLRLLNAPVRKVYGQKI